MHQTSLLRRWCERRLNGTTHWHSKDTYTNIHKDTASMYPQLHPRHSTGSQTQKGVAMETCSLLSVPPEHCGLMITPLITHIRLHTHMHHKYFNVHTVTSKHTHTDTVYYHTNQQSHSTCSVYSVFLHKISGSGLIHLQLDTLTSSDLTQNSFFF